GRADRGEDGKGVGGEVPGGGGGGRAPGRGRGFSGHGQGIFEQHHAVDVVNSSDASHLIVWKREGLLAPFVPEDVAKHYPAEHKDADGMYASFRVGLCIIAYNTSLVKAEHAPKSFATLPAPKRKARI